jgi:hypothetical protein
VLLDETLPAADIGHRPSEADRSALAPTRLAYEMLRTATGEQRAMTTLMNQLMTTAWVRPLRQQPLPPPPLPPHPALCRATPPASVLAGERR